jgi:hypothetical protein
VLVADRAGRSAVPTRVLAVRFGRGTCGRAVVAGPWIVTADWWLRLQHRLGDVEQSLEGG